MSGSDVTVEQHGAYVGVVTLERPPNNYFDTGLIEDIAAAYEALDGSGWCRAIVLASKGRHFCAGLDFAGNAGQDIAALYRAALRLFAAPLPVVAAVQGAAIGGGCGLALSADFRVATAQSRFSANFARLGFHHGFALTVTLPAAVGRQAALLDPRAGGDPFVRGFHHFFQVRIGEDLFGHIGTDAGNGAGASDKMMFGARILHGFGELPGASSTWLACAISRAMI